MSSAQHEIEAGERFAFGDNWAAFLSQVDEERIAAARDSLVASLGRSDLEGMRFLDAGCGSGLFSLAAHRLGADVVSFDFDPASVGCAEELRARYGDSHRPWTITRGSVLDKDFLAGLGTFDVVYSWGVLHHTGQMWDALSLIDGSVSPGGQLFISIYNDQGLATRGWTAVKRRYNHSGPAGRRVLLQGAKAYFGLRTATARTLRAMARRSWDQAPRPRGMSDDTDLVDWVGGYPFEVAMPEEIFSFYRDRGYQLENLKTCRGGHGCNEYVLRKTSG